MEYFRYSFFAKLIFRYGNIIVTPLLLIQLISSAFYLFQKWYFIFPIIINAGLIFLLNRFYYKTYKLFPFFIQADNKKIICRNFFLSKKVLEIKYEDIDNIDGGIFNGYPTRPIYLRDGKHGVTIGFYSYIGDFRKLITKLLQNIPQDLYDELAKKLNKWEGKGCLKSRNLSYWTRVRIHTTKI